MAALLLDGRASKLAVAIHEAGHVVATLAQPPAPPILGAWIKREQSGWGGNVQYVHRFQWAAVRRREAIPWVDPADGEESRALDQADARKEALVCLAGPLAEIRWRTRGRWNAIFAASDNAKVAVGMRHEASDDFGRAVDYLEWIGVPDLEAAFVEAWNEAEELLHRHWAAVMRLGRALKEREQMPGEDVVEVVGVLA